MFDFLKNKRPANPSSVAPVSVSPSSNSTSHSNDVRRELVRVVLKDTLRQHGIPLDWLACEVIVVARSLDREQLHIQLVMKKWNEQLLRYAVPLQEQLLLGLDRFDPEVDHSKYVVSWRFSSQCGSPYRVMPEPDSWLQAAQPKPPQAVDSVLDRRRNPRPSKAAPAKPAPARQPSADAPFDATQIAPLS